MYPTCMSRWGGDCKGIISGPEYGLEVELWQLAKGFRSMLVLVGFWVHNQDYKG